MRASTSTTLAAAAVLIGRSGVHAANATSTSTSSTSSSPFIPSGISAGCSSFLSALDQNSALASCSSSLLSATSAFDPSSSSSSSSSTSAIQSALGSLCSADTACSASLIKQQLTYFNGNCSSELAAGQALVKSNYDVLYVLYPFTEAVCAKDDAGSYCALEIGQADASNSTASSSASSSSAAASTSTAAANSTVFLASAYSAPQIALSNLYVSVSDGVSGLAARLLRRGSGADTSATASAASSATTEAASSSSSSDDDGALMPNATTFSRTNLPFLFISGSMSSGQLCTACTKRVLAAYVAFETEYPYGQGLANSPILGGQSALWSDVGAVCGSGFLSAITKESGDTLESAAPRAAAAATSLAGLVALLAAALFAL